MNEEKDLTLEERFEEMESILKEMEESDISLEDSFSLYEKGMKQIKDTYGLLTELEAKVEKLDADGVIEEFADEF